MPKRLIARREFMRRSVGGMLGALAAGAVPLGDARAEAPGRAPVPRGFDTLYEGEALEQLAFPLGGLGAGMICLEGAGALTNASIRNRPEFENEPGIFAALSLGGPQKAARVVEGPVPRWKLYRRPHTTNGEAPPGMGLPRFQKATFRGHFPFGRVELEDPALPVTARITGWSPFEPGDPDNSSLPVAGLEYTFTHVGDEVLQAVFSFHARNFLQAPVNAWEHEKPAPGDVRAASGGFTLFGGAWPSPRQEDAWFSATTDEPAVRVNLAWFRGEWFDPLTMAWRDVEQGAAYDRSPPSEGGSSPGASLFVPFRLLPGESRTVRVRLAWYSPATRLHAIAKDVSDASPPSAYYRPWYGGRFGGIDEVTTYWRDNYVELRRSSERFSACFFDTTLPAEVIEAAGANLSVLKSPTVLRQSDGRLWGWEGCDDDRAQGPGSCTHVWNYAQAVPHLFPSLERTLRETEFTAGQDETGHQNFRVALPIQPSAHDFYAAADGQLGGIMKVHREWRIGGDTQWLRGLWPRVRASLDYCVRTWDPDRKGWLEEPQHTTYDIRFWGPGGMTSSIYLGALQAAVSMGRALGEPVAAYEELLGRGKSRVNNDLFNGEYFYQRIEWKNLREKVALEGRFYGETYSPEAAALLEREGPKYQYGSGCLSDGVIGSWLSLVCAGDGVLDPVKVRSHLKAVHRHNFRRDLADHPNPQRPTYALGHEGGLLLCSWPLGGMPSLPFVYSNEVWTGIEYQSASHMMMMGLIEEGVDIVRACRARYDGRVRNPFDEYEWGHWYARSMASYALIQALSGARYDAVDQVLHLEPSWFGDFRSFLATGTGYGTVGVAEGKPFLTVVSGSIPVKALKYTPASAPGA